MIIGNRKKINNTIYSDENLRKDYNVWDLDERDYDSILSMMYERFGGRPIEPSKVETGNAISRVGTGDILPTLINYPEMSIAEKIYTYMIEVKYKNNDIKLASWLKEYEDVMGSPYTILDSDDYDKFMKAYQEAFRMYGQDVANDTLLDYGFVLTPDVFESKISLTEAMKKFSKTIKEHFGDSSFYRNRGNAEYVAKSYMMAKKMCENSAFTDITDIYACDIDVVSHTVGLPNKNIILLADTQVIELNDDYGTETDSDYDNVLDYKEAHTAEEVDITPMIKEYCKYNEYSQAETEEMILKNSKIIMYNYRSNPKLPDSDFDGRPDANDGTPLNNTYNSKNETDNYSNIKINFSQDYRYFFMDNKAYYEEMAEMGLILSNMASKKKNKNKRWDSGQGYVANDLKGYMFYIGLDNIEDHTEEKVPYSIAHHDTVALFGKVNNLQKNIITLVIGEDENYKNIMAANYDGQLGIDGEYEGDHHHIGYDVKATRIYNRLVNYSDNQTPDWKKAYWIVGYGTGGSIANLVAKKLIDLKGNREAVFCYTYQAPGTINRNNIKSERGIINTKYYNTFNLINTDDPYMYLENEDFDRYGRDKLVEAGFSSSFKAVKDNFLYNQQQRLLTKMFIQNDIENDEVIAFGLTFNSFKKLINDGIDKLKVLANSLFFSFKQQTEVIKEADENGEHNEAILAANIHNTYDQAILSSKDAKYQQKVIENNKTPVDKIYIKNNKKDKSSKLLPYIENMAKYYINYIATYRGNTKEKNNINYATTKALEYYNYLQTNNKPFDIYDDNNYEYNNYTNKKVLKSNIEYLSGEEQGYIKDGKNLFYYDEFKDLSLEESKGIYKDWWTKDPNKYGKEVEVNYNKHSHYIGDDCTGFSQAVIYDCEKDKGSTEPRGMNGTAGQCYGIYNHNTNAEKYLGNNSKVITDLYYNLDVALRNLGYVKLEASSMKIEDLKPGDLLCSKDHVEYYVGNDYEVTYNDESGTDRQKWKKTGISDICHTGTRTNTLKEITKKDGEFSFSEHINKTGNKVENIAQGTFGWGNVNDEFPLENASMQMSYFYKVDNIFRKCTFHCTNDPSNKNNHSNNCRENNLDDGHKYSVIWRYER